MNELRQLDPCQLIISHKKGSSKALLNRIKSAHLNIRGWRDYMMQKRFNKRRIKGSWFSIDSLAPAGAHPRFSPFLNRSIRNIKHVWWWNWVVINPHDTGRRDKKQIRAVQTHFRCFSVSWMNFLLLNCKVANERTVRLQPLLTERLA